jgi:hypothetical protein
MVTSARASLRMSTSMAEAWTKQNITRGPAQPLMAAGASPALPKIALPRTALSV